MRPEAIGGGSGVSLPAETTTVRVWDTVVRIFHWGVVAACILNLFILEEGKMWHRYVGYAVAGLLAVRLVWGLVGSRHARFSDFVPTPGRLRSYVRDLAAGHGKRQLGHNPLAAVMMVVLMLLLGLTASTGFMSTLDAFWGVKWVKNLHEVFANSILWLAAIHAVAAIVESWQHRENLIWSMVTGRKRAID